ASDVTESDVIESDGVSEGDVAHEEQLTPEEEGAEGPARETGSAEAALTSASDLDCSICETTRQCCDAVNAGSYCNNFSAERCAAYDPGRQATTKRYCLVVLRTIITAWQQRGAP